jgi:hypothetical protein
VAGGVTAAAGVATSVWLTPAASLAVNWPRHRARFRPWGG